VAEEAQKMYRVYTIVERPKQDDFWLNIGAGFPHEKGTGFNIILQAHPIGEKLVMMEYEPKEKEAQPSAPESPPKKKA
jgi:hypothetical protein